MKRLKYVSQWAQEFDRDSIDKLVAQAAEKNAELGITGILMTSGRLFFQVIEGPAAEIDALYEIISNDERHVDVLLLNAEENVKTRIFPDWSMRKVDLDSSSDERLQPVRDLLVEVHDIRLALEEKTHNLERAIWSELAALLSKSSD